MAIRVTCPNGHVLKVKDSFAGKVGLCPSCKARIHVPRADDGGISEDTIADILDDPAATVAAEPREEAPVPAPSQSPGHASPLGKTCHVCNEEIAAATHICPFCHTYIAKLADF